jgi:putative transposase
VVRRILVATDQSESATQAVRWAADMANRFQVSRRRIQQIARAYRETGKPPVQRRAGRPSTVVYPVALPRLVLQVQDRIGMGAAAIAQFLRIRHGIHVGHGTIHAILQEHGRMKENKNKQGRRRPWVRYERSHSLSLVHMDWHYVKDHRIGSPLLCVVLDDASRKVLAATESQAISSEASIALLTEAYEQNKWILPIQQVITDHGGEFYANTRDKDGHADHSFEVHCREKGIHHILCRVGHPQANGKIEKFFDTYEKHRWKFPSLEEFVEWCVYDGPRDRDCALGDEPDTVYARLDGFLYGLETRELPADHAEYSHATEARIKRIARHVPGSRLHVAALTVAGLVAHAEESGYDPGTGEARSSHAAALLERGEAVVWPPGRNEPCWCGSDRKYKKCCGPVSAAADDPE